LSEFRCTFIPSGTILNCYNREIYLILTFGMNSMLLYRLVGRRKFKFLISIQVIFKIYLLEKHDNITC
jgi:hypothetical protein